MVRVLLAVVLGYVTLAVAVMLGVLVAWLALGSDAVFDGDSTSVTATWSIVTLLLGIPAAGLGGFVAARLGQGASGRRSAVDAVRILTGLVLVLGVASGVWQLKQAEAKPQDDLVSSSVRAGRDFSFTEAGRDAVQPTWYLMLLPWTGALSVLFGGAIVTRRLAPEAEGGESSSQEVASIQRES